MPSTRSCWIAAVFLATLILRGLVPGFAETGGDRIYWADPGGISWSNWQEGSTPQRIITADTRRPGQIAVDASGRKIYWVDKRGNTIQWSDLDGSNSEPLPGETEGINNVLRSWSWSGGIVTIDIALDLERGRVYCAGIVNAGDYTFGEIYRANLDGSDPEIVERWPATSLALDTARGFIYLASGGIYRVDLSGSGAKEVVSATYPVDVADVALDWAGNKLYWTTTDGVIRRSNPDGSDVEVVLPGLDVSAGAIALDPEEGKVYWAVTEGRYYWPRYGALLRANLDGSGREHVVEQGEVVGFDLDLQGRKIYWTDARGTIHRANVDGTGVEDLLAPMVRAPYSVALDPGDGRIYWSDLLTGSLQRAGMDGSGLEIVVGGLKSPKGICLDGGRLYWADSGTGKIQSADLDGSHVMDIAAELSGPDKVAVDPARRIYWTEQGRSLIRRADLDGTHVEDYPVESAPKGIALDVAGGKVYWTWTTGGWGGPTGIGRCNLDGTEVENLSGDIDNPDLLHLWGDLWYHDFRAVALDPAGGKIYWMSMYNPPTSFGEWPSWGSFAFRADLDGSVAERVPPGGGWRGEGQIGLKVWPPDVMGHSLALDLSRRTAVSAGTSAPLSTTLRSSYPNPFNGSALISYTLAAPGPVSLVIYNTLGQPVRTLVDKVQAPGPYSVPWQPAETLASGVYVYRLTTADAVLTRRLALVR
ncbi:MAG: T9SS type A sorting domain-containing protein [Gemmatimonadaceae bacterium]|nr:T9SS type A sorting domain-containing protein [Gemmatimonadaceae bacterium]